jgi:hypothetical protein
LEGRGIPTVMICTNTFAQFGRRVASTQGWRYVTIAETANPIQDLTPAELAIRAEAMLATVIDGLTVQPAEIELRLAAADAQMGARGVARSSTPV